MSSDDESMDASDSSMSSASISMSSSSQITSQEHIIADLSLEARPMVMDDGDSDSDSDVSMAAETDDSEDELDADPTGEKLQASATEKKISSVSISEEPNPALVRLGIKLQSDSSETDAQLLPEDLSLLPAEIWHHIFTFTTPKGLGRLLSVNKLFHTYLNPSFNITSSTKPISLPKSLVPWRQSESIWQASRKLFLPQMPIPLHDFSELAMWKLARGWSCHFCDKSSSPYYQNPSDEWHPGPGENRVCTIWAFGIRACGSCLQRHTVKEIDLLMSSSMPVELMAALPFVLLTNDLHVLGSSTFQNGQPPSDMQYAKCFYKKHIDAIRSEFFKVKSMGSATLDEWMKGLEDRGKDQRNDALRWERWHISGGLERVDNAGFKIVSKLPNLVKQKSPQVFALNSGAVRQFSGAFDGAYSPPHPIDLGSTVPGSQPRYESLGQPGFLVNSVPPPNKHERTKEAALKRKAARRAEIERRCQLLDPPIPPEVLIHAESFQAAIQIGTPFTDVDWDNLKPRILAQMEEAQAVAARLKETGRAGSIVKNEFHDDGQLRDGKDLAENEWEEIQAPIRERIAAIADDIIKGDQWQGGTSVTKDNSSKFAVDVLLQVRKRFYLETSNENTQSSSPARAERTISQKLVLENMKWVYDNWIKPHTEKYRKELFLCNGCDNNKLYALEGVIQHYAAKHTSSLSCGSVVVHWKAEWPEEPPFSPNTSAGKPTFYNSSNGPYGHLGPYQTDPTVLNPYGPGYRPDSAATMHNQPPLSSNGPPYYQPAPFPEQYPNQQYGTYQPPVTVPQYPPTTQVYQGPSQYSHPQQGNYPYQNGQEYPPEAYITPYTQGNPYEVPPQQAPYGAPPPPAPQSYYESNTQYSPPYVVAPSYAPQPGFYGHEYQSTEQQERQAYKAQLEDVARNARDLWNKTSGVKEMPGSVRVQTIIYHLLQRSRTSFPVDPPLTMLIDGLSNNREMRPVRNVNELTCLACTRARIEDYRDTRQPNKKSFSLPQLFSHFQSTHIGVSQAMSRHGVEANPPDWTTEMVELPDLPVIADLEYAPGMDEDKLQLIQEAIPEAFKPIPPTYEMQTEFGQPTGRLKGPKGGPRRGRLQERAPFYRERHKNSHSREYDPRKPHETRYQELESPHHAVEYREHNDRPGKPSFEEYADGHYLSEERVSVPNNPPKEHYSPPRKSRPGAVREFEMETVSPRPQMHYDEDQLSRMSFDPSRPLSRPIRRTGGVAAAKVGSDDHGLAVHVGKISEAGRTIGTSTAAENADRFLNELRSEGPNYSRETKEPRFLREPDLKTEEYRDQGNFKPENDLPPSIHDPAVSRPVSRLLQYEQDNLRQPSIEVVSPSRQQTQKDPPRPLRPPYSYEYNDRHTSPRPAAATRRGRSPEPADHRYKVNNVSIYREERQRQGSPGARRTPSRYARYESVRLEQERARSRSPVYIKVGSQPGRYRERSPPRAQMQPTYGTRPQFEIMEEVAYERIPRQEYYRIYADAPRPRQVSYEDRYEYIQIPDRPGEYYVRTRPMVRREVTPVYLSYDEEPHPSSTTVESRSQPSRVDPAYFEEYDPRHPEPPTTTRQIRYER